MNNGDGTFAGGPLDTLMILHNVKTGRYHSAFFEEHPAPGPVQPTYETQIVHLISKMHHTEGADTLEGAQIHLDKLAEKIQLPKESVFRDKVQEWNGELATVLVLPNWRIQEPTLSSQSRK